MCRNIKLLFNFEPPVTAEEVHAASLQFVRKISGFNKPIGGHYVTRLLDQAAIFRGYLMAVRTDNGPEFTSRAFNGWAQAHHIVHLLIEPGRPMQNGYIESFNRKFRDECLNEHWFENLQQARIAVAAWRQDYNEVRPHSSCQRMPPAQFAARHRQQTADATLPKVEGTV